MLDLIASAASMRGAARSVLSCFLCGRHGESIEAAGVFSSRYLGDYLGVPGARISGRQVRTRLPQDLTAHVVRGLLVTRIGEPAALAIADRLRGPAKEE